MANLGADQMKCALHDLGGREVPKVGLEPTPPCGDRILSPARLPSTWRWKQVGLTVRLLVWQTVTSPLFGE